MEKLISDEERIRRAEDVLERRKNSDLRISSESFSKKEPKLKVKKMFIQIMVCMLIYCGIYYTKNSQNEKVKNCVNSIDGILEYDVNFKNLYNSVYEKINKLYNENKTDNENAETTNTENAQDAVTQDENDNNIDEDNADNQIEEESNMGIGGGSEDTESEENTTLSDEEQMQIDADYIKQNINLINPLSEGRVTSKFGSRESSEIVSANHKGIDLGATTGSSIISATDGVVIEASSEGDFGIHLKIKKDDVIFIYAHCSELLVKEGETITQGQQIAKVGSTGKATGPHLHFEIRKDGRAVNPEYLLEF